MLQEDLRQSRNVAIDDARLFGRNDYRAYYCSGLPDVVVILALCFGTFQQLIAGLLAKGIKVLDRT